jgi:hypothetical protein
MSLAGGSPARVGNELPPPPTFDRQTMHRGDGRVESLGTADLKTTAIYAKVTEGLVRVEAKRVEGLREGPDRAGSVRPVSLERPLPVG